MQVLYCVCYSHARPDSQWDGLLRFSEREVDFSTHLFSVVVQMSKGGTELFSFNLETLNFSESHYLSLY